MGIRTHGHKNYGVRTLKGCNKILLNASTAIMNNGYNKQSKVNWFYDSNFVPVKSLINIAYVHCGEEYNKEVTSEQQKIYKELNKYSEYKAIFMVHSHVIGSQNDMNIKDECYISNGLGNFISQQKMLDKQKGVITILEFDLIDKFIYSCESYETENILLNGAYITVSKQLDKLIENDDINLNF